MNRLQGVMQSCAAQGRSALIPYLTAGDPHPGRTAELMHALVRGGADVIELGVPFSDPMADGPTIQLACERALAAGTTMEKVLQIVADFRSKDSTTPVVLMGYLNPLLRGGSAAFCSRARAAGVDGVLAVDLTIEEADSLQPELEAQDLCCIFLLAPTTSLERAKRMSQRGSGYLYYVSLKGVTGSAQLDVGAVAERLGALREVVNLPLAVGFGIRTAEHVAAVAEHADGVIVGSALVELIAQMADSDELSARLEATMSSLKEGISTAGGRG